MAPGSPSGSAPKLPESHTAHLRPRRSPRMAAAGVLLACLGGLGAAVAYQQAAHSNQVVVVQRPVARGEQVQAGDLAVVTIGPAPGVRTLPAERLGSLVGQQALVDLAAGSLVGEGAVGRAALPKGKAQIGLKLVAGRVPNAELPAGTRLNLVEVTSDKAQSTGLVVEAEVVLAPELMQDGSTRTMDVAVPETQAERLADLAARDLVVVVRQAGS
ncbi:SAF domain-containing protein [Luteococcus sp. Sow4_B9]|uniref:SAF domain-containing protein n=1 Tax=Luteococcus sp. Sow4_B9 TaxID=3438792 RepID=UPI003F974537